jgi:membrane protein
MSASDPSSSLPSAQPPVWDYVSRFPLRSLWDLEGLPIGTIAKNTWRSLLDDNLVGRAAELGFFFLFALFPALFTATSILGLVAHSSSRIYYSLLGYLAVLIPRAALGTVLETFKETTASATSGKLTFGLAFAIWSASVGFSSIQDSLNVVYKVKETRSYLEARLSAIGITVILMILITLILSLMLGTDLFSQSVYLHLSRRYLAAVLVVSMKGVCGVIVVVILSLFFAVIYYFAPNVERSQWHWLTPGAAAGITGWLLSSVALRAYVHFFNNYSATYGGLGAVIILLTWFYLTGLMLLLGAEINSQIEAAAAAKQSGTGIMTSR